MRETLTAKWLAWIVKIRDDISASVNSRRQWVELTSMWGANRALRVENEGQRWIARIYAASAALAVRRQVDREGDCVSLARLLDDLRDHAKFWTIEDHLGEDTGSVARAFAEQAAREWCVPGARHLNPELPRQDLDRLLAAGETARHYADRVVAHTDKRGLEREVTYAHLHTALAAVESIFHRYYTVLTCVSYVDGSLEAHRQFNHETIYRRAWLRPRWRHKDWPPGLVQRDGDLRPAVDILTRVEYAQLVRNRRQLASVLSKNFVWPEPGSKASSPIRDALQALGLSATDSAVQWVRDYLVLRGATWPMPDQLA